jgi:IS5 family transposase
MKPCNFDSPAVKHRPHPEEQDDLLRLRLIDMIDGRHELVEVAALFDLEFFEREWARFFPFGKGRPVTEPQVVAELLYLHHANWLLDKAVVGRWVENPYCQHFTGKAFFRHRPPIDPSSLMRWRGGIGEEGVKWLLTQTIRTEQKSGLIVEDKVKRVAVDTTVMEKNIAYPTDAQLYEQARDQLAALAQEAGVDLRQSFVRLAPRFALQVDSYAHAQQFKRMRRVMKRLKGYTGRVMCNLRRQLQGFVEGILREGIIVKLALVSQVLHQQSKGANMIYALHEPEVDCISKAKARARNEFGCKVSVATTLDEGFVVGMRNFPGNPYDGHTLLPALEQVEVLTDQRPILDVVARDYRGHGVEEDPRLDQWHSPRPHAETDSRPPPPQRHRSRNRSHENRRSPVPTLSERYHRRRGIRCPERLQPQHPKDPGPTPRLACLGSRGKDRRKQIKPPRSDHRRRVNAFFRVD